MAEKVTTTADIQPEAAKPEDVKYVKVTSPAGSVTTVPESLVEALKESGYKVGK